MKIGPEILDQYSIPGEIISIETHGDGHINDTFLLKTSSDNFILQRVNKNIFRTNELTRNYEKLFSALQNYPEKLVPKLVKTKNGKLHAIDQDGCCWRLSEFIKDSKTHLISTDTNLSYLAARSFGKFQHFLNSLDASQFGETIRHFHDPESRLSQFMAAMKIALPDKIRRAVKEIEQAENLSFITKLIHATNQLLERITHNDTKLNNIIFEGDRQWVIDLDTVMPGMIIFDFGDMVRSYTSPVAEDEADVEKTLLRENHFEAITSGYLEILKSEMTDGEKQNLLAGAKSIIYEQGLRFLTDYLAGDLYFKTAYPEHNLVRARNQFKLLADLIKKEKKLQNIIDQNLI